MEERVTEKLSIWGIVQGVGFRPFAAKLAARMGLSGWVMNCGGLVEIVVRGRPEQTEAFASAIREEKPLPAEIVHMERRRVTEPGLLERLDRQEARAAAGEADEFAIAESSEGDGRAPFLPADLALCDACLQELKDENDRRFRHPFISCMACGPRYTIIDRIPYDRCSTSMADFPMCPDCSGEYTGRSHRRYHAQTVSCHSCGPQLEILTSDNEKAEDPIAYAAESLKKGAVIAFKGVGGYNFICDPENQQATEDLRKLKGREEKPFAVMFRDTDQLKEYCFFDEKEEALLTSPARPILLLKPRRAFCESACRSSRQVGAFLPSMGSQWLLLDAAERPLIVTSGNRTDEPIIYTDEAMFRFFEEEKKRAEEEDRPARLRAVVYNRRSIRVPVDDSVARIIDSAPQIIRRSKGYVPVPFYLEDGARGIWAEGRPEEKLPMLPRIFAAGGDLKSSFCLQNGPFAYVSQYFGDLDSGSIADNYKTNLAHMEQLFRIRPELVAVDMHPAYRSRAMAVELARSEAKDPIKVLEFQHHHAHIASVMAEHHLKGPVLGFAFDGTGYGPDGTVWGGEALLCEEDRYERLACLEPVRLLGGDSASKESRKSAFSYLMHIGMPEEAARHWSNGASGSLDAALLRAAWENGINCADSSSMGRLFDAVSSLLGICHYNTYEGESAILLENAAEEALELGLTPLPLSFEDHAEDGTFSASGLIRQVTDVFFEKSGPFAGDAYNAPTDSGEPSSDTRTGGPFSTDVLKTERSPETDLVRRIALGFHNALAEQILRTACRAREQRGVTQIALSGGVFQNKLLLETSLTLLRQAGFDVYFNQAFSPGDGAICLGQSYLALQHCIAAERKAGE